MRKHVLDYLLVLLAFSLPFEIVHPILVLPWFEFTNLEVLAIASLTLWFLQGLRDSVTALRAGVSWRELAVRGMALGRRPLVWLPILYLALSLLSSLMAPSHRLDALKFDTRIAMGIAVFWMVSQHVRTRTRLYSLLWALVMGAGISTLAGLGEAVALPPLAPLLALFKEAPTRIGGELRVSATLLYATVAAIFFEMIVPLALGLSATARTTTRRWLALAVALFATANVVLTLSRAGLITLVSVLAVMILVATRQTGFRRLMPATLAALTTLVFLTGLLTWQADSFRSRLVTENDLNWYGASYTVPSTLRLTVGEPATVTIAIKNTGTIRWHASGDNPFALGYYWLANDRQAVQQTHIEVPLPQPVTPGETVRMTIVLTPALPPGDYQLAWGMLQHHILWFRHRNIPEAYTTVHIAQGSETTGKPPDTPPEIVMASPGADTPLPPPTVGRLDLWTTAIRMWVERPLLGVGPDNFRHLYGSYLNLAEWDRRLHANNLYLELLVGWGVAGALAFAAFVWAIARRWLALWRAATGADAILSLALGGSLLAFFVHGLLDYFLEFVPLYLLFWTVVALVVALADMTATSAHNPSQPPEQRQASTVHEASI